MAGRLTLVTQGWRKKQAALWELLIPEFIKLNTMFTELFPSIQAVTATSDGLTTGLITAGKNFVTVTSANAGHQITLPASSVGTVIKILVGATGCELICATAADKINDVVCGATNEAALTATNLYTCQYVATNLWVVTGLTKLGAAQSALVPDAR
jgi:hypothetical protein